jgi:hypothetical protein
MYYCTIVLDQGRPSEGLPSGSDRTPILGLPKWLKLQRGEFRAWGDSIIRWDEMGDDQYLYYLVSIDLSSSQLISFPLTCRPFWASKALVVPVKLILF